MEFYRSKHDVQIICRDHPELSNNACHVGVKYIRNLGFRRSRSIVIDLIKDFLYSCRAILLLPKTDIVVTNTFWLPILFTFGMKPSGTKIVVNIARMPKGQYRFYGGVDRLSAVSVAVANRVIRQAPHLRNRVRVIPNPIDTTVFKPPEKSRALGGRITILYAGRLHPEKGVHILLEAFRALIQNQWNVELIVVGPWTVELGGGGGEYYRKLRTLADGLPVFFKEAIFDKVQLAEEYQKAHVFVYPSVAEKGESFGLAPLEAMATGLVPVLSRLDCFTDFFTDGVHGVSFQHTAPDAAGALCQAAESLLRDRRRLRDMGQRSSEKAKAYSIEAVAKLYLRDFAELTRAQ